MDARTFFFYLATVNTPAVVAKLVGRGSQYGYVTADKAGDPFDGVKTYRLNVPANVPAKDFWSFVLYDPQTRSELQTGQPLPSKNNKREKLIVNADGSVDLYIGPKAPAGKESNWTPTRPGGQFEVLFRLYGPEKPFFDKTWVLPDIEVIR
jgi:hypothetical protein